MARKVILLVFTQEQLDAMTEKGLYGVLSEEELVRLAESGPPRQAAEAIINRVRGMGLSSQSNISAALAQFGG